MTDTSALSSCPCYTEGKCPKTYINVGKPSNLGVGSCLYDQRGLRCSPVFEESTMPKRCDKRPGYGLNRIEMSNINPDFGKVSCPKNKHCNKEVYVSHDPRLMDTRRNSLLKLDRPPYRSTYFISNNDVKPQAYYSIYCPEYDNYGKNYQTYSDINAGQITYYIDPTIEDPYFKPNFTIPAKVEGVLYKDPMGSLKPTYVRKEVQAPNECYNPLSFIRDSAVHREDIMAGQMAQMNQMKWSSRWKK